MDITTDLYDILKNKEDISNNIIGKEDAKDQIKSALLMGRHIILIGPPGVGKTTMAKTISKMLPTIEVNNCGFNCDPKKPECPICKNTKTEKISYNERFVRIQGSPDLTVEDLIGDIDPIKALKFGPMSIEAFTPGKIFKANQGILFFDEVNRCPERLQNALLQVLEEGKATIGGYSFELPANFVLIATMNPEDSSTERLSDVFLDRFDAIYMGYPENVEIEEKIVNMRCKDVGVSFPDKLQKFTVNFIQELRRSPDLEKKPGVRATIGLVERSKANAIIEGRTEVKFIDIKNSVISVLSHRIRLKPSLKYLKDSSDFINETFTSHSQGVSDLEDSKESDSP